MSDETMTRTGRRHRRPSPLVAGGLGLLLSTSLAACSDLPAAPGSAPAAALTSAGTPSADNPSAGDPSTGNASTTPPAGAAATAPSGTRSVPVDPGWAAVDDAVHRVAPDAHLLVAEVSGDACRPLHAIAPDSVVPVSAVMRLYVLHAVAQALAAGRIAWAQQPSTSPATRSPAAAAGTDTQKAATGRLLTREALAKMLVDGDATATDQLIALVGRAAVETSLTATHMTDPGRNEPFLTTREMAVLTLNRWPLLAAEYTGSDDAARRSLLAGSVDTLTPDTSTGATWTTPRDVNHLGWFASAADVCRAYASLSTLVARLASERLAAALGLTARRGPELDGGTWQRLWSLNGTQPGVLAATCLATTKDGRAFVAAVLAVDPAKPIPSSAETTVRATLGTALALAARS